MKGTLVNTMKMLGEYRLLKECQGNLGKHGGNTRGYTKKILEE